jgi:hypothetical protein
MRHRHIAHFIFAFGREMVSDGQRARVVIQKALTEDYLRPDSDAAASVWNSFST